MLGRARLDAVLVDPHDAYPEDFRCEKLDSRQIAILEKTGLADQVLAATVLDGGVWVARGGRHLERRASDQHGIRYEALVNTVRSLIPSGVEILRGNVTSASTTSDRQLVTLSDGQEISARLIVMASGLNLGFGHALGLTREMLSPCHSISIGFDLRPVDRPVFAFPAFTYWPESPRQRMAYLTLFPVRGAMRANLMVYREMNDPWLRRMRTTPREALLELMPGIDKWLGAFDVDGVVRIRPADLYATGHYMRPGLVLVGDAFATSCPAAGTGTTKVFNDAERLCNVHIPRWLASDGMGLDKVARFYEDPVKREVDAASLLNAHWLRSVSVDTRMAWRARRTARLLVDRCRNVLRGRRVPPTGTSSQSRRPTVPSMAGIRVDITSSTFGVTEQWADLSRRAVANVFMDPAALNTVFETGFSMLHVLTAWDTRVAPQRLVGLWALQETRFTPLGPDYLLAPAYNYSFLSTPVIDPAFIGEVATAFLSAIDADPNLPKLIRVKNLDGPSEASAALLAALARRGTRYRILSQRQRPFAAREDGVKTSGSTRKKMRQDWNRLSAAGAVDIVNDRAAIADAIEVFLGLEAAGWKGEKGTALLSKPSDARFARRFLTNLATGRKASVALLRVDGEPIAAQVLLYEGDMAYTWKTAYDQAYAKYSPGALLLDKITEELFSSGIAGIESCSTEDGFMGRVWQGRRETLDLLADVGARPSLAFSVATLAASGRAEAKKVRDRLRTITWPSKPKSPSPAAKAS